MSCSERLVTFIELCAGFYLSAAPDLLLHRESKMSWLRAGAASILRSLLVLH